MGGSVAGRSRWIGKTWSFALIGMMVLIFLVVLAAGSAQADTTFTVDRSDDASAQACTAAANDCSIRGAISAANATPGADTINFASGISTLTLLATTDAPENNNALGDLDITDDLSINGGPSGVIIEGGAGWNERVIDIIGAATTGNSTDVTIADVTVRKGNATVSSSPQSSLGGGIRVNGSAAVANGSSLTLQRSTVTNNTAVGSGGGIYDEFRSTITLVDSTVSNNTSGNGINGLSGGIHSSGSLSLTNSTVTGNEGVDLGGGISIVGSGAATITDSTVSGNTAASSGSNTNGGGIYASTSGTVTLTRSTVSSNIADSSADGDGAGQGGGIYADGATMVLKNTTVSGNTAENGSQLSADGKGGGIHSSTALSLANTTIANNKAGDASTGGVGGGIFGTNTSTTTLRNTIVAANNADIAANFAATPTSQGYNLLGENPGNLATTDIVSSNPLLGPLAANGGPTQTHALLSGSPAIDAGNPATPGSGGNACETADQRGQTRPQDGNGDATAACDIGAFEKAGGGGGGDPALTIGDVRIKEGNRGFKNAVFTARLDAPPSGQVTVDYATANGSAKTPSDYTATSGTLTFDQQTETISVPVKGDRRNERNESFFVNLSSVSNATLADAQGRATIVDND